MSRRRESSWGETYLRRTARGEDHAPPPKRGDGTVIISVTTGSETRTISVSSVEEAIAALERRGS